MESVALSRTTRWGMLLTGLLQGVLSREIYSSASWYRGEPSYV
ncbi:hypothetical protein ONQ97_27515 [Salmonella enterica subsp. enterica serovar Virginia]|nr:hypothetical protein [Salmonella enterica subsp. enterica serovar Virginia]